MNRLASTAPLLLLLAAAACATNPAPAATAVAPGAMGSVTADAGMPASIRWYRSAAERHAMYLEVYRAAGASVERHALGAAAGSWGVILDADETVLDNSRFEQERAAAHAAYSDAAWVEWVRRQAATALPGAVDFTTRVHRMGGRVVIVTNRADSLCAVTRANLQRVGIAADEVLCQVGRSGDKNPRFEAVERGTPPSTLPPLRVLAWVGDNIQDFPSLAQAAMRSASDSAFADFGDRFFALPNPMYGSWERNPLP